MRTRTRLEGLRLPLVSRLLPASLVGLAALVGLTAPVGLTALVTLAAPAALAEPTVGEAAPEFRFDGPEGKTLRLSDYVGKKGVVLAWFPKAFTPG